MFDFRISINDEVVHENLDPRQIVECVEVLDLNGGVLAEIPVAGKAGLNIRFRSASLANRPYAYLSTINSPEWAKACAEYDASLVEEPEGIDLT